MKITKILTLLTLVAVLTSCGLDTSNSGDKQFNFEDKSREC